MEDSSYPLYLDNILYNNLKNSCDFIGWEPWSIRGQTHRITSLVFKMSKIFENSTEFI
jgi:hypothetical protein